MEIEFCDYGLNLVNELTAPFVPEIVEEDMEHALGRSVECALLQETLLEHTVLNLDTLIEVHQGKGGRDHIHTCVIFSRLLEG